MMRHGGRWKLGILLMAGYVTVVAGMTGTTMLIIGAFRETIFVANDVYLHPFTVSNAALEAQLAASTIRDHMLYAVMSRDTGEVSQTIGKVAAADRRLHDQIDIVDQWFLGDLSKVAEARALAFEWTPIRNRILNLAEAGRFEEARGVVLNTGTQTYNQLLARLVYVNGFARDKAAAFTYQIIDNGRKSIRQTIIVLVVGATTCLGLGGLLVSLVLARLKHEEETRLAMRIVEGKLTTAEAALSESREWFHQIFNATSDIIAVIEMKEDRSPGRFVEVNDRASEIWGYDRDELLAMSPLDLNHGIIGFTPDVRENMTQNGMALFERVHRTKDGRLVPVEVAARVFVSSNRMFFLSVVRDISERRRTERQIAELHDFNSKIISECPVGIIVYSSEGPCVLANEAAAATIGATIGQVLTTDFLHLTSWRTSGLLDAALLTLASGERQQRSINITTSFGREIWAECNFVPIRRGDQPHLLLILQDMTPWNCAQLDLQAAKQAAEAASESKSAFLANMSHEIRTPMNAILGLVRLVEETALDQEARRYLVRMKSSARALLGILNDILDFSKIEAGRMELECVSFQLDKVMEGVTAIVATEAARKGIETIVDIDPQVPLHLLGDSVRLEQVLLNLAVNAVKFTTAGEIVLRVTLAAEDEAKEDENNVTLEFSVRDTGIGIDPGHHERLFHAFSQADNSTTRHYGGTGLGLAICSRIVALMKGTIGFTSEPGEGSDFRFTAVFGRVAPQSEAAPAIRGKMCARACGLSILVVDDNDSARHALEQICRSLSWNVDTAASGPEGLAALRSATAIGRQLCFVLVDWRMPEMNGLAMLRQAKADPTIALPPILLMTDAFGAPDITSAADLPVIHAILTKPVMESALIETVTRMCANCPDAVTRIDDRKSSLRGSLIGLRILLVEDCDINQEVAGELLRQAGATVHKARNGIAALSFLEQGGEDRVDVVLMDVQMPGMNGYDTTRLARQRLKRTDLPILAMTANATTDDREKSRLAGMQAHIPKPIDVDALLSLLAAYLPANRQAETGRASSPESEPDPTPFADLPGIDQRTALLRLGGNQRLFLALLDRFVSVFRDCGPDVRRLMAENNTGDAAARLHHLRGVAANLGMDGISRLATSAEAVIRDGRRESGSALAALETSLSNVIGTIAALTERVRMVNPETLSLSLSDILTRLGKLRDLAAERDFQALDAFEAVRPHLSSFFPPEVTSRLVNAFEGLDFASAKKDLEELLTMTNGQELSTRTGSPLHNG
ncbi:MAG: response regulator [Alphaproteobacteria bacterium]|nr:response regulator [Alphaproteobacteria bacterium]